MTIPSTPRKAGPLLGNGVQTSWPFTFKVFADADILVTVADNLGIETPLTLTSDYTVTLNPNQETSPGGTVTYLLPDGYTLVITGDIDYDQPLDLPSGGAFSPTALENELDRLTMQIQQLREAVNRAVQAPITSNASGYLPSPQSNALIGWNESETAMQNFPLSEIATAIAFATYRYDTFTGDGTTTSFALSADPVTLGNIDVSVDGQTYVPGVDHTLVAQNLVFTVAPANGVEILARYGQGMASGVSGDALDISYQPAGVGAVLTTVEAKLKESVSTADFATLVAAVSAIGSDAKTLNITTAVSVSSNLTIPANVEVRFSNAGFITITGNSTLTINGPFVADSRQVFNTPTVSKGAGVGPVLGTITNNVIFGGTTKTRPTVNPRWFGAGGGTDDWAALQAALWCVTQASPGITVQLEPRTTYTVSLSPVIDTSYFRLIGAPGAKIVRKNGVAADVMNLLDTGHEGRYTWGPHLPLTGVEVLYCEFDGNKASATVGVDDTYDDGLSLLYLKSSKIIGNVVRNCLRFGIAVSNSNDVIVKENMVYDCDENGLYAETGSKIVFSGNLVDNCSTVTYNMGNISMSNIVGGAITGNVVLNGYDGIYLRNVCNGVSVTGNAIKSPARYGVWVKDETDAFGTIPINNVISGNTVVLSGSYACHLELARKISVTGNNFNTNGAAYALRFRNGQDQTISGNVYTGHATAAVSDGGGNTNTFLSDVSGTYTPVSQGASSAGAGTYSVQTGRYTRQSNRCQVYATTTQSAHTGTGQARITLPFTANASDASVLTVNVYGTAFSGSIVALVVGGQSYANLWQNNGGTLTSFTLPAGAMTCTITGEYEMG